jgi:membrane-associated phospholipid phosphatase
MPAFVTKPDARPVRDVQRGTVTFLIGLVAMVATLTAVGVLITSTEAFDGVRDWDSSVSADVADDRTERNIDLARFITTVGDTLPIVVIMAAATIVLAVMRKWRAMIFIPLAMLAEIVTFLTVNHLVGRERPDVDKIGPLPGTFSFPSGHVAATLVCWVGVGLLLAVHGHSRSARVVAALGALMAVGMAWARVYVGMHYTTDVLFGLAMGVAALVLAVSALGRDLGRASSPAVSRDVAAGDDGERDRAGRRDVQARPDDRLAQPEFGGAASDHGTQNLTGEHAHAGRPGIDRDVLERAGPRHADGERDRYGSEHDGEKRSEHHPTG